MGRRWTHPSVVPDLILGVRNASESEVNATYLRPELVGGRNFDAVDVGVHEGEDGDAQRLHQPLQEGPRRHIRVALALGRRHHSCHQPQRAGRVR